MKSRERVKAGINRETPDRIPTDYAARPEMQKRLMSMLKANTHRISTKRKDQ